MSDQNEVNLAFCWYEPDEWLGIKKFAKDADKQDDTYEEWRANANEAIMSTSLIAGIFLPAVIGYLLNRWKHLVNRYNNSLSRWFLNTAFPVYS